MVGFPLIEINKTHTSISGVEFDSFEAAVAAYESDGYKTALEKLEGGVVRDFRILEGVD